MQYDSFVRASTSKNKQDIQYSKINLNRSMSQKPDSEIEEAKAKLKRLEGKLSSVLEENKVLFHLFRCSDKSSSTIKSNLQGKVSRPKRPSLSQTNSSKRTALAKAAIKTSQ